MLDWKRLLTLLDTPGQCIITTHISPDGDAIGSELALAGWLTARGHAATIINSDSVPPRYSFLDEAGRCELYDSRRHDDLIRNAATVVVVDVARPDRLGGVAAPILASAACRVVIDHHPPNDTIPAEFVMIDPSAAATGEILFEMMEASGDPIDAEIARALYVAIMTDTGSFRYSNTSPRSHRIAGELLRSHNIDTAGIFEMVYERSREARLRLLGLALSEMEVLSSSRVVVVTITREMMQRAGASPEDADGFVEMIRGIEGCRVAAVFSEMKPGEFKVSLRSKGSLDVNRLARQWGGGGHTNAAGIPLQPDAGAFRKAVVAALMELAAGAGT